MADTRSAQPAADGWRLRGDSLQLAVFTTAVFLVGASLALALDVAAEAQWDPATVQTWTLVPQLLVVVGLFLLGRSQKSTSFTVLAVFVALIVIEEAFHVLNPVSAWLAAAVGIENEWSTVRLSVLNGVLIYGFVALVGVTLLIVSHWHGSVAERRVVRNLAIMLFVAGFFGGPISTVATLGNRRRWMFIEECGEAVVFAVMVGYVAGLIALSLRSATRYPVAGRRSGRRGPIRL